MGSTPYRRTAADRHRSYLLAILTVPLLAHAASAQAQQHTARAFRNPPLLSHATTLDKQALAKPAALPSPDGERRLDLGITYTSTTLYNPSTGRNDPVRLRSYVGPQVDPNAPLVAPTIETRPGETVRVTLHNRLPADPSCTNAQQPTNQPHCFNGTNLHSHGLWVSPTGNSDNVLLSINPGVSFEYEYNLPADHPSGTFWYHTHRHGSTALQVASGMGGALIVRGNRTPGPRTQGDIDTLLRTRGGQPYPERVLVMQQIPYACVGADGKLKYIDNDPAKGLDWSCKPGETGVIESYEQFGPGTWDASGRYTSINGLVLPVFRGLRSGQVERWRAIHAGVRDTITLEFRKMSADVGPLESLKVHPAERTRFAEQVCAGEAVPYHVVASDGLTMAQAQKRTVVTLQPAYRNDLLMVFPEPGRYCVVDGAAPAAGNVTQAASGRHVIGFVDVGAGPRVPDVGVFLREQLIASAQVHMPASVRQQVVADLRDGLKLSKFTPHPDVQDSELRGEQHLVFFIDTSTPDVKFEVGNTQADLKPYDPARIDRRLKLGDAEAWVLQSHFVSHPFHIHVNPFQIVKILDPNGRDVSAPGAVDDAGGTVDPQYPGLKGVWKDTLWIKSLIPGVPYPKGVYTIHVRTRYQRYIGEFVLHCHILDHEDQGMMQNVSIELPDGAGGLAHGHH